MSALDAAAEWMPALMTLWALLVVAIEWIALSRTGRIRRHREGVVNVLSGLLSFVPVFALGAVVTVALMTWLYQHRLFDLGLEWYVWVLAWLAYDLSSFVVHFVSHKVRILWCMHSPHHAPEEMKASVAFRGSFADFLVTPHVTLWLPLLGFHPAVVLVVDGLMMGWGVMLHLNPGAVPGLGRPGLRRWVITPSTHRLHHARDAVYLDSNYGLSLAIWDRLLGVWQPRIPEVAPRLGVSTPVESDRLGSSQLAEFAALWRDVRGAPRWVDKVGYLLMPPGWAPGGGETATQIRRRALAARAVEPRDASSPADALLSRWAHSTKQ